MITIVVDSSCRSASLVVGTSPPVAAKGQLYGKAVALNAANPDQQKVRSFTLTLPDPHTLCQHRIFSCAHSHFLPILVCPNLFGINVYGPAICCHHDKIVGFLLCMGAREFAKPSAKFPQRER